MAKLIVITVNYHSDREVAAFLGAVGDGIEVVVVDNGADDPAALAATIADAGARLVRPGENLGYFGGAQAGLDTYLAAAPMPDWVVVANPDIRFDPGFFALADIDPAGVAAVAPAIRSMRSGCDQNPYLRTRPSRRRLKRIRAMHGHAAIANAYRLAAKVKERLRRRQSTAPAAIYAPHGSCLALSRTYFAAGGTLGFGAFLFCEELHVAETARRHGLAVRYRPDLAVTHKEHATTGFFRSAHMVRLQAEALDYCLATYW